ncbi:probable disease resistance protein RPP1 [Lycium ferocissimum]|uniref:probable disease resistance protein RPP1 n=1 Tax=Lycium ferocissimum TaxID=112874 RepID=UPI002815FB3F|nr:probable disease resistance protein RPP1 [Lycium ferocissimum]
MLRNNFSLEHLSFSNCRQFRELPQSLYNLRSLKSLKIDRCTNFSSIPVPSGENHLTSLQSLELSNCDGLTSLPSGMLEHCRSLESLEVKSCNNLVSFPLHFGEMPSLSYMNISECPKLNSVPTGGFHRLTGFRDGELHIGPFSEMVDFEAFQLIFNGIQQLSSLRTLWVYGRANLDSSLPHQLMQLSSLTWINIFDFGIEALPHGLGNLTSLEKLELCKVQTATTCGLLRCYAQITASVDH